MPPNPPLRLPEHRRTLDALDEQDAMEIQEAKRLEQDQVRLDGEKARNAARRAAIQSKRETIIKADEIFQELGIEPHAVANCSDSGAELADEELERPGSTGPEIPTSSVTKSEKTLRARLGTHHYLMFEALSVNGPLCVNDIATLTGLQARRIRDQMLVDVKRGTVEDITGKNIFSITDRGADVYRRFIAQRRERNLSLPTIEDVRREQASVEDGAETE